MPVLFFYFKQMLIACLWALIQKNDLPVGFFAALGPGGGVGFTDIKESIAERLAHELLGLRFPQL